MFGVARSPVLLAEYYGHKGSLPHVFVAVWCSLVLGSKQGVVLDIGFGRRIAVGRVVLVEPLAEIVAC